MSPLREFARVWAGGTLFATVIASVLMGGQVLAWVLGVGQ